MARNLAAYYKKSKSKIYPKIVKVKGKDIVNPTRVMVSTNILFRFFLFYTNFVDPYISKTIPGSSKPFRNFLKNSSFNTFLLKPTKKDELHI